MNNFVVYKSSAGSGKTFTLVKEYLRLALSDDKNLSFNYKRILALTFTNKAAAEMKSRVIDALYQITQNNETTSTGLMLGQDLKISEQELKRRAQIVLSDILHHYSDFSVGTIDSFTHKIIKTFAHDLKLPVNFNIEMDTKGFYEKVIDTLFSKVGEDAYISKLLTEYALSKAQDNTAWDPQVQIQEFSELLLKENSEAYRDKLKQFSSDELEGFRRDFSNFIKEYQTQVSEPAEEALQLIKQANLKDEDFVQKSKGPQNFFKKCINQSVDLLACKSSTLTNVVQSQNWAHKDSTKQAAFHSLNPQLHRLLTHLISYIEKNYTYYSLSRILSKQMYALMLIKKIEEISAEQKSEDRLVFISEFNQKISEIIHNEPTPFIYERLGERYRHFLLDEFQDTSTLQWHNILPLLDNSLANGWLNLIVGDGKQSIYRWRNADVKQFASLPILDNKTNNPLMEEMQQSIQRNYKGDVLKANYRSLKTVVEFNNSLFVDLSESLLSGLTKTIYEDQAQEIKNNAIGFVSIHTGKKSREDVDDFNFEQVRSQITQAIADGFDYKDICIICRVKRTGSLIANQLIAQKIPVVSSDSLLLQSNFEVNTIVSYLSYLSNKEDHISAAAVINYLFQSKKINEKDYHICLSGLSVNKSLFEVFKLCGVHLEEAELSLNNLFDNCIEIINALGLNQTGYQYIRFFLDEVNEYLVLKNSNIASFFDWWQNRKNNASMIIPDNTNAVKIMTIHTSKGLEFPVVIVPHCSWQVYKAGDTWVDLHTERTPLPVSIISLSKKTGELGFEEEFATEKQDQTLDNLNLLYVAFTRAVERLHIISVYSDYITYDSVAHWLEKHMQSKLQSISDNYFELGALQKKQSKQHTKGLTNFDLQALSFNSSNKAIQIKAAYLNNTEEAEAAKQSGLLMHWLLSKMYTVNDLSAALNEAVLLGLTDKKEAELLKQKLTQLCSNSEIAEYFAEGLSCKLEAELIMQNGEILRPDRIVFKDRETILIDYKTGKENNKHYSKQLLKYETALVSMGYTQVKKLLVYMDDLKIVSVN
jgi:ATP-dependent exoDNAse (exonuclease V) beta subunit